MPRSIEKERATVPSAGCAGEVCRMHGAGSGAPIGNRNALKHGAFRPRRSRKTRDSNARPNGSSDNSRDRVGRCEGKSPSPSMPRREPKLRRVHTMSQISLPSRFEPIHNPLHLHCGPLAATRSRNAARIEAGGNFSKRIGSSSLNVRDNRAHVGSAVRGARGDRCAIRSRPRQIP